MVEESHGVCVKVRHHRKKGIMVPGPSPQRRWADVIDANRGHMETMIERGKAFVRRISEEEDMPTAVSFSGGKDSLATLLLVLEAGFKPPVVFVDTGIELPETIVHVREVAERHDLELIVEESDQDFVARSCQFGPPSRDYRWCCKTQKLGPVARALNRRFPGGMITFIGQRRYESGPRSRSGAVWRNPWVPGQVGASPIQDWTALHIWLYIMMRDEPVNPWYDLGLERIGCYPCPATDLADLEVVERHFPGYGRWRGFLEEWASAIGHDVRWVDLGLWRFRNVPKSLREISPGAAEPAPGHEPRPAITFQSLPPKELQDAGVTWYEARGVFDRKLDMERAAELLTVLGRTSLDSDVGMVTVGDGVLEVGREGSVVARGHDEAKATKMLERARQLLVKAELCVGCGVCVPRCPEDALCTEDLQIRLERSDCMNAELSADELPQALGAGLAPLASLEGHSPPLAGPKVHGEEDRIDPLAQEDPGRHAHLDGRHRGGEGWVDTMGLGGRQGPGHRWLGEQAPEARSAGEEGRDQPAGRDDATVYPRDRQLQAGVVDDVPRIHIVKAVEDHIGTL
jgi:phosphoadenosine phosphosulfate reductase